jgi:hypothetical protein
MADPRRIVRARTQLHMGQVVQYGGCDGGKLGSASTVSMKDHSSTLLAEKIQPRISVSYAAILLSDVQGALAHQRRSRAPRGGVRAFLCPFCYGSAPHAPSTSMTTAASTTQPLR